MRHDDLWREIRALRAAPPKLAVERGRRQVFGAALQQSQELMEAAQHAGPASEPLLLFYCLSQAGRAIAAARAADDHWEIAGHGLSIGRGSDDITRTTISPRPRGDGADAYAVVARSVDSPTLQSTVTLAAVWASLPELTGEESMRLRETPAFEVRPSYVSTDVHRALTAGWGSATPANVMIPGVSDEQLTGFLARFADTDGWVSSGWSGDTMGGPSGPTVRWESRRGDGRTVMRALDDIAVQVDGHWYLRPLLGHPPAAPRPLLGWWALLLALSSLARYHPAAWTTALDVDVSQQGVALEACLALAERRVPELIVDALGVA